jgi:C-terminal processing protease CtpA/Prc
LYTLSNPNTFYSFEVKTVAGKTIVVTGAQFKTWQDYVIKQAGQNGTFDKDITYTSYGNIGYIDARAFNARNDRQMDSVKRQIAGMFRQAKEDGVKAIIIDVSRNGGGNSQVGDVLIDYFYSKPYRTYQCNWRRSDEYLALIKSWGNQDANYAAQPAGKVIHFDSDKSQPTANNPDRYKGKVYVMVGNGTFSSAIMFATVIKDNHIATLIGQVPQNGHPNHFGELYATKLPNTKLDLRFGVKEWIRPAGKAGENVLRPDILLDTNKPISEIIKEVVK